MVDMCQDFYSFAPQPFLLQPGEFVITGRYFNDEVVTTQKEYEDFLRTLTFEYLWDQRD